MKISVLKLVKSRLKKININNLKKKLDKKVVLIAFTIIFISIIFTFFLRPVYFNFQDNKKTFESHIYNNFNLKTKIRGKIDYNFFPTPRIEINNVDIVFKRNEKNKINIKRMYITISPFYLKNIEDLKFSKILVSKQKINIYPSNLKEIFNHFSSKKKKNLKIINSEIYFIDDQNNKLKFDKFNLSESFLEDKHNIFSSSIFSGNEIKIKFTNNFNSEKYLKISVPNLKQSLNIKFDQSSNLTNLSGEMKLDIFQSILLLNFKGKDEFKISNSYLRNKFLNSKINGTVSFKNPFYFNLKMNINRIHLKKALKYFPIL